MATVEFLQELTLIEPLNFRPPLILKYDIVFLFKVKIDYVILL